jgi:hypothetical protein
LAPPLPDYDRPSRLRSYPILYGELVAHLFDHPRVFIATCFNPEEVKSTEVIVAQPDQATLIIGPPHVPAGATSHDITLLSARDCVELTSYRAALTSALKPPTGKLPCNNNMTPSCTMARGNSLTFPPIARSLITCRSTRLSRTHRVKCLALRLVSLPRDAVNVWVLTTGKLSPRSSA